MLVFRRPFPTLRLYLSVEIVYNMKMRLFIRHFRDRKAIMQVTSKWIDGMCFVGTTENGHSVVMEGAAAEGQAKRGPSPELLGLISPSASAS